jgi:hypothetical protein
MVIAASPAPQKAQALASSRLFDLTCHWQPQTLQCATS